MRVLVVFCIVLWSFCGASQNLSLQIHGIDGLKINHQKIVADSIEAIAEGQKVLEFLYDQSYLGASIDSMAVVEKSAHLYLQSGKKYKWISLSKGNIDPEALPKIDVSDRLFLNRPFNAKQLTQLFKRSIQYFENNGYPFASIRLDSVTIDSNNKIRATLKLNKNQFYLIDSVIIKGESGINKKYLLNQLGIKEGSPYQEEKIAGISNRLREIPFVSVSKTHQVQFFEESVKIVLYLERKKASRFDGVIGLLTNEDDGKIELTGDVDLNLLNSFKRGEKIGLNWRKLKGNSQDLNLEILYPYFLNTAFGTDFDFKLYKKDTTFLELTTQLGINYAFNGGEIISLFLENKTSSLLSRNSLVSPSVTTLPNLGDVQVNSFGVNYTIYKFNYRFNPNKGFGISTTFSAGRKTLKKIAALEAENPNIYDGIDPNTTQYNGQLSFQYFLPIKSRSTILIANQSAILYADNERLFQNELFRIGGLKILRGFDEESISASAYSIMTLEYRFLLDRNSYFSLFTDRAYYENKLNAEEEFYDRPFSVGAGLSFETNTGIFTFNYAVGKQFDNPLQFQAAKIHFGFVNFF